MARILGTKENTVKLYDRLSGTDILFGYRMPTTAERISFQNEQIERKGQKIKIKTFEARLKAGSAILTSIRTGDFKAEKDGRMADLSCRAGEAGYMENWKDLVRDNAADLIVALATIVFDGSVEKLEDDDADEPAFEDAQGN